jgi:3-oxoadipate enol-lactonase
MTTLMVDDGTRLAYQLDGPTDAPPILFLNSLGCDLRMWQPQSEALADQFRVVRFDMRGHGRSDAPPGPYSVERLGRDAVALLDALGIERAHICGLSLGGLVALWLAIHRPGRVMRAVFANTAARIGTDEMWAERIGFIEANSFEVMHDAVLARFLSARFRERDPETTALVSEMLRATPQDGYLGCCAALRDADLRNMASTIESRSLVIGGELDVATSPAQAEDLHGAIVPSELMVIPGVAHLSNLEAPELFNRRLRQLFSAP